MAGKNSEKPGILIIDDDEQIRKLLKELLSHDYDCRDVSSAEEALSTLRAVKFELVLSDINLEASNGLDLVPQILEHAPETVVVMISGQQTIESAIEAMRAGAFDYITKPLDLRHVQAAVHRALSHQKLLQEKKQYENHLEDLVRQRTAEIAHLAYYDSLTDLPNRLLLADRFEELLKAAERSQSVALLLVGLDRLKKINDTLSHTIGDLLLKQVATRLLDCVGKDVMVARFGGDEFALLLSRPKGTQELANTAFDISEALKPSFVLDGHEVYMTASVGISLFPRDGKDSATILRNASAALYCAKKLGGNHHQFYMAHMNAQSAGWLALETSLRRALVNEELLTYYQPIVNLASGNVVGLEALVRWQHPERGILPPAEFLGLAEDTGLIMAIGDLVMRDACIQTCKWRNQGLGDLRIAINVTARQFREKSFLDKFVHILQESGLDPRFLELEITETSIMENLDAAAKLLNEIRGMGISIAIDDFGTGYSSLGYLKRLPIDTVKLDRSFVQRSTTDPDDAALVMGIIALAQNLKLKVVAEGIEKEEQLAFLRLLRCEEGQGYLFGKPVPAEVFERSMSSGSPLKQNIPLRLSAQRASCFPTAVNVGNQKT